MLEDRVIVSHDTDFGTLLAVRRQTKPSFVLIRSADPLTAKQVAGLIVDNLHVMAADLTAGAIVTFARGHLRSPAIAASITKAGGTGRVRCELLPQFPDTAKTCSVRVSVARQCPSRAFGRARDREQAACGAPAGAWYSRR